MGSIRNICLLCALLIRLIPSVKAQDNLPGVSMLFHEFDNNCIHAFTNGYGLYHLAAIAATYGLVKSGTDWRYYQTMVQHKAIPYAGFPSVILGGIVPVAVPLYLYVKGKSQQDQQLMCTSYALGQAAIISLVITSGYKAITGRHPPQTFEDDETVADYSDDFNFGFMRRGIFNGWPSGHTTTAFAMATTLIKLYPHNHTLKWWAWGYAILIGWGVSTNIHWLSDVVAGALIGYSIGNVVGSTYHRLLSTESGSKSIRLHVIPYSIQLCFYL
jgi:membrane-associated phospholipid phosphatase